MGTMKKVAIAWMVVVMVAMVFVAGCAIDRAVAAKGIAQASTMAYMKEKGNLDPKYRAAVDKAWEAFKDAAPKITKENIVNLPADIKAMVAKGVPEGDARTKVNALIDDICKQVDTKTNLSGANGEELVRVVLAIKDGIQEGIDLSKTLGLDKNAKIDASTSVDSGKTKEEVKK